MFAFNPFTGTFDVVKPNNFSYNYIINGFTLIIPMYQQMSVHGTITIDGTIIINGELMVTS